MKEVILCDSGRYLEASELCKKYNLSVSVDAFCDPELFEVNPEEIKMQLGVYGDTKICSMHGPYTDLCLGSKDKLIKAATMNRFEYAYQISRKLNCKHIILHHGYVPATSYPPNWVQRAKIFFEEFLHDKSFNTEFHIENQLEHTPDLISEVVSTVNDKRLNICLDVGHANCNSKTPVLEWIKRLSTQIGYVHLHNNNGQNDEHLGFIKGNMNFWDICRALDEYVPDSIWGIEANSLGDAEDSIIWLIDNGFLVR
jgi:sugar phosphate isomerase/epimerase